METTCIPCVLLPPRARQSATSAPVGIQKTRRVYGCACNDQVTNKSNRAIRVRLGGRDPARRGRLVLSRHRCFEGKQRLGETYPRSSGQSSEHEIGNGDLQIERPLV